MFGGHFLFMLYLLSILLMALLEFVARHSEWSYWWSVSLTGLIRQVEQARSTAAALQESIHCFQGIDLFSLRQQQASQMIRPKTRAIVSDQAMFKLCCLSQDSWESKRFNMLQPVMFFWYLLIFADSASKDKGNKVLEKDLVTAPNCKLQTVVCQDTRIARQNPIHTTKTSRLRSSTFHWAPLRKCSQIRQYSSIKSRQLEVKRDHGYDGLTQ